MKNTITSAANEARRYICDAYEMQIRPATAAEIVEFDGGGDLIEVAGNPVYVAYGMQIRPATPAEIVEFDGGGGHLIEVAGNPVYVDGKPLVGRDALGRVAIWASQQNKLVDARFCSWRDVQIALASIGGRSTRTVDRGGKIEQVPAIDDFAAYLDAVGQ